MSPKVQDSLRSYIGIDVGGTFTDVIFFDKARGEIHVVKVPTSPQSIESAIVGALSTLKIDPSSVRIINHATTIATNALMTHTGLARTALVTNRGFRDVLEIGRQRRAQLYNLYNKRPAPLVKRRDRFTIGGRMSFEGMELEPVPKRDVEILARKLAKYDCVAVGFLNSYANQAHEREVARLLSKRFKGTVITSSEVNDEYREYERFSTAVVNAALVPLVSKYLNNLERNLRKEGYDAPVYLMNSDGNVDTILQASKFPVSIIESGPAAGVLACADLALSLSLEKVATFDMGGTTAKAGMVTNFRPEVSYEFEAAGLTHSGRSIKGSGYPVRRPFIDLAEVGAGGGTIAWVDEGGALRLGPESAGADPGPAAYGLGGTRPTVTDANILTGRLSSKYLLGGKMELHPELAEKAISKDIAKKLGISALEASLDIIRVVNHNMAKAISIVTVERGRDPRDYTMMAFGGAGPLHGCDLAEEMSITRVIVPPHPGLFSAYGLLIADLGRMFSTPVMSTDLKALKGAFEKLQVECSKALRREGFASFSLARSVDLRYLGQSYEINVPYRSSPRALRTLFDAKHWELYGYSSTEEEVEAVNAKIRATIQVPKVKRKEIASKRSSPGVALLETRDAWISGRKVKTPVFTREKLLPGSGGEGHGIIEEYDSTTVVNSGWTWFVDGYGNIQLSKR
jgi:N-methylhydantoinase A